MITKLLMMLIVLKILVMQHDYDNVVVYDDGDCIHDAAAT
jgi:hypothetical protein